MRKIQFVFFLAACASTPDAQTPAARPGHPVYHGSVSVDPATQHLAADWRIAFAPDSTTADSVTLLLNRGLTVSRLAGSAVSSYAVKDTSGFNNITVRFTPATKVGDVVQFDISYAGVPRFGGDSINSIRRDWIELGLDGFWHPVFSGFNQSITGSVELKSPPVWMVVGSGEYKSRRLTNTIPLIDMAFVAAPRIDATTSPSTTVYHVNADSTIVNRIVTTSAACVDYLNQRYSARGPLPHAKMVLAPRNGPGYARKNYIVITDIAKSPADAVGRFICHELAHYWSSGAVSSGPENWLNEGLAEFVSARFVRATYGEEAYQKILQQWMEAAKDQPPVWTPTTTRRPGPRVAYRKAPYIMHQMEQKYGTAIMERILEAYMVNRIATTPALLASVGSVAGAETAEWLRGELAK